MRGILHTSALLSQLPSPFQVRMMKMFFPTFKNIAFPKICTLLDFGSIGRVYLHVCVCEPLTTAKGEPLAVFDVFRFVCEQGASALSLPEDTIRP